VPNLSQSAAFRRLAEAEHLVNARAGDDQSIDYVNDPEENLEHLRVDDDGATIEVGDGKPQPAASPDEIEALTRQRLKALRLTAASPDNLLARERE
jgi:hypothetical protein